MKKISFDNNPGSLYSIGNFTRYIPVQQEKKNKRFTKKWTLGENLIPKLDFESQVFL